MARETDTKLINGKAPAPQLPTKENLLETIGHIFFARPYGFDNDLLFIVTSQQDASDEQIVVLHPQSYSGCIQGYEDLNPSYYSPVTEITYDVKVAS